VFLVLVAFVSAANWFTTGENAALYKCPGPRVRKSWGSLTDTEKSTFVRLVYQLKQYQGAWATGTSTSQSALYDVFVRIHNSGNYMWHYTSAFIHAHKAFLWMYESALIFVALKNGPTMSPAITQTQACNVAIPYWPWETDFGQWETSSIWDSRYFGDNTPMPAAQGYYVDSGQFAQPGWKLMSPVAGDPKQWQTPTAPFYDNKLKRLCDPNELRLSASLVMDAILNNPKFSTFLPWIHGAGHSCIHLFLGFSMKTQASPDEPLFFLHHCNVDRLFHLWADCYEYDKVSGDALGPDQYSEINPTPGGTQVKDPSGTAPLRILPETVIPFYWGNSDSKILVKNDWPTVKQMWTMGTSTVRGWNDLYVRYGPDKLAQALSTSCTKTKGTWSWVNYSATKSISVPSTVMKRDTRTEEVEDNETKVYRQITETLTRKTEVEGLSPKAAIREMAMEDCMKQPKPELKPEHLSWLRMMGIAPSTLDRICDEPSSDPNYRGMAM
jgi:tyrosinase